MSFLLAKIIILLLLSALLGLWLGRWTVRRHYRDVTQEYSLLDTEWRAWRHSFEDRLAQRPAVDLKPLSAQVQDLDAAVRALQIPRPMATDLGPVLTAVSAIRIPPAQTVDMSELNGKLLRLDQALKDIRVPTATVVDLGPTQARLDNVERAIKAIQIPAPREVDLAPTHQRLAAMKTTIEGIRIPPAADLLPLRAQLTDLQKSLHALAMTETADLSGLNRRLSSLEDAVRGIRQTVNVVDLDPVMKKLQQLDSRIATVDTGPVVRVGSRNLLQRAAYGRPDDLSKIHGVADVLEKMLHDIGVYYFWQIAEWTPVDVAHADAQLTAFRGRIERDEWVKQATELARGQHVAARPDNPR